MIKLISLVLSSYHWVNWWRTNTKQISMPWINTLPRSDRSILCLMWLIRSIRIVMICSSEDKKYVLVRNDVTNRWVRKGKREGGRESGYFYEWLIELYEWIYMTESWKWGWIGIVNIRCGVSWMNQWATYLYTLNMSSIRVYNNSIYYITFRRCLSPASWTKVWS